MQNLMPTRFATFLHPLAIFTFLMLLADLRWSWVARIFSQASAAELEVHAEQQGSDSSQGGLPLFTRYCVKCHEPDGKANAVRVVFSQIPDFTRGAWQKERSDPQLVASILNGKGADMPAFAGKLSDKQARELVAHIRALGGGIRTREAKPDDFDVRFRQLEDQLQELKRQSRAPRARSRRGIHLSIRGGASASQPRGDCSPSTAKSVTVRLAQEAPCAVSYPRFRI